MPSLFTSCQKFLVSARPYVMSYIERKVADFDPKEAASLLLNIGTAQIIFSTFRKARLEVITCIAIGMLVELLSKTKTSGVQLSKVIVLEPDTYVVNPRLMIGVSITALFAHCVGWSDPIKMAFLIRGGTSFIRSMKGQL